MLSIAKRRKVADLSFQVQKLKTQFDVFKDFVEGQHPRDKDGEFTSGGGGGSGGDSKGKGDDKTPPSIADSEEKSSLWRTTTKLGAYLGGIGGAAATGATLGRHFGLIAGPPGAALGIVGGALLGGIGGAVGGAITGFKIGLAATIVSTLVMLPVHGIGLVARGIGHVGGAVGRATGLTKAEEDKTTTNTSPKQLLDKVLSLSESQQKKLFQYVVENMSDEQAKKVNGNVTKISDFMSKEHVKAHAKEVGVDISGGLK